MSIGREDLLRQVPLFRDLRSDQLAELIGRATRQSARKGAVLIGEGDADPNFLAFLTSGRANVIVTGPRAREVIVAVIDAPGIVGEIGLLDGSPRSATVKADVPTEYLRIGARQLLDCMRDDGAFAVKVARHVASTLRRTNEQLRVISTMEAKHRVVWCLSILARQRGTPHDGGLVLEHNPLHRDIGDMTGLSRETATRALRALVKEHCITQQRDRLIVHVKCINRYLEQWHWLSNPRL